MWMVKIDVFRLYIFYVEEMKSDEIDLQSEKEKTIKIFFPSPKEFNEWKQLSRVEDEKMKLQYRIHYHFLTFHFVHLIHSPLTVMYLHWIYNFSFSTLFCRIFLV